MARVTEAEQPFDLNIERVLEHWPVSFAIREIIANALDEATLTGTAEPDIFVDKDGRWHIRDYGRGLTHKHLTQKENTEKRGHPDVVGQFGMGLKDALAAFDRRGVGVEIRSPHGDITTGKRPKAGFSDIRTLHALVRPPSDPNLVGTDVIFVGATAEQVNQAKRLFLRFSDETRLETTRYGQVLARGRDGQGRIYVKGLLVAEEPNFLFSYNITDINAPLRRALNRERSNVGRTAYTDRVKKILVECRSSEVAKPLAADLAAFSTGRSHDELAWRDVALHACRVLQSHEKVVFVTAWQLQLGSPQLTYAQEEGYRLVTVPDDIAAALGGMTDLDGRPMIDLDTYRQSWNDSFSYAFVDTESLSPSERAIYQRTAAICALIDQRIGKGRVKSVAISETMRLSDAGHQVLGVWDADQSRIIVRRDQLQNLPTYAGTLLHEFGHAISGTIDGTMAFEEVLTTLIGKIAARAGTV